MKWLIRLIKVVGRETLEGNISRMGVINWRADECSEIESTLIIPFFVGYDWCYENFETLNICKGWYALSFCVYFRKRTDLFAPFDKQWPQYIFDCKVGRRYIGKQKVIIPRRRGIDAQEA